MLAEVGADLGEEASSFFPRRGPPTGAGVDRASLESGRGGVPLGGEAGGGPELDSSDFLRERRLSRTAPKPFFRSPKWTTPEAYLASTRTTATTTSWAAAGARSGSLTRPPRFPLSRLVLWDRTPFGDVLDVNPNDFVPRLHLSEDAVMGILAEVRSATALFELKGSLTGGSGFEQRLTLGSEAERELGTDVSKGEPGSLMSYASVSGASKTAAVEFVCHDSEDDMAESKLPEKMRDGLLKRLSSGLNLVHWFGPGALMPTVCRCCTTKGSKSKELLIRGSMLVPSARLQLKPIYPLLMRDTSLSQSLSAALKSDMKAKAIPQKAEPKERTGFLTMDQGHRLLPLLENEPLAREMPLLGVWVTCGPSGARSSLVYSACLRFLYGGREVVAERTLQHGHFLLLLFSSGSCSPQCFECSFSTPRSETGMGGLQSCIPDCTEYAFSCTMHSDSLASKSLQPTACDSAEGAQEMEACSPHSLLAEPDDVPEEPRPLAPTPSALDRKRAFSRGEEERELESSLWPNLPDSRNSVPQRKDEPPEPEIGPGFWAPTPWRDREGFSSRLDQSAAAALISQQQRQIAKLERLLREGNPPNEVPASPAPAPAVQSPVQMKGQRALSGENEDAQVEKREEKAGRDGGSDESLMMRAMAGLGTSANQALREKSMEGSDKGNREVISPDDSQHLALADAVQGASGESESEEEILDDHLTTHGCNPVASLDPNLGQAMVRVRYTPLESESESEEELKILSKYISLEAYRNN